MTHSSLAKGRRRTAPTEPNEPAPPIDDATTERIEAVASDLHARLLPLIEVMAGTPPRPVRLIRRTGIDKSLASRLVRAARVGSGPHFLHAVPSPSGLRILLDRSAGHADPALLSEAAAAVDRFEAMLDGLPGGRQALDARLGATSVSIRRQREHVARQASFKAVSFLFGHYCDTLVTTLFMIPSATPGKVDLIEVHRRIGLQRLAADAPMPLMSLMPPATGAAPDGAPCVTSLDGDATTRRPDDFLIADFSSAPLPALRVVDEGTMVSFVLEPVPLSPPLPRLTSASRVMRVTDIEPAAAFYIARRYMLHTPCRLLVRDIFLAKDLWPMARLQVGFYLPGPTGSPEVLLEPGRPNHRQVNLTCHVDHLPPGPPLHELDGVSDQLETLRAVLARVGQADALFRGWRCTMSYPVPLLEMQVAFRFAD